MKSLPDDAVIILGCLICFSGLFVFPISLFGLSVLCMELGGTYVSQQFTDLRPGKDKVLPKVKQLFLVRALDMRW